MQKQWIKAWNSLGKGYNFVVNIKLLSIDPHLVERAVAIMKKTLPKKIGKKRKARIVNGGSEASLFLDIIKKRKKTDLTGKPISEENARSRQFAHILPKGMYPELRLNPNNIIIVDSIEQHERVDQKVSGFKAGYYEMVKKWTAIQALRDAWVLSANQKI